MEYGKIEGLEKPVSRIVFGTAFESFRQGDGDFTELLDFAVSKGITTFDCAKEYGKAQEVLGNWIRKRGHSEDVVIETKGCHPLASQNYAVPRVTKEALDTDIAESLDFLHVKTIDVFMLHRDDPNVAVGDIMEWLNEHFRKGDIMAFGGSNWSISRIAEANEYARTHELKKMTVSSPHYSLAEAVRSPWVGDVAMLNGADPRTADERAWYRENQMAVFAYSVLSAGFLSGAFRSDDAQGARNFLDSLVQESFMSPQNFERLRRAEVLAHNLGVSVAQIVTAWVLSSSLNTFALLSSSRASIVESNAAAVDLKLNRQQREWLNLERDEME